MGADTVFLFKGARVGGDAGKEAEVIRSGRDFVAVFWPVRFQDVAKNPTAAGLLVEHEFERLLVVHRDRRGVLAFPDIVEPRATSYRSIVAEVADAGIWVPMSRPRRSGGARRAARVELELEIPRDLADATNTVIRELPAVAGSIAMSEKNFAPRRVVQATFRTSRSADDVAEIYARHLSARGLKVSREAVKIADHDIVQVIARAEGRVVTVQAEQSPSAATDVRVTSMVGRQNEKHSSRPL